MEAFETLRVASCVAAALDAIREMDTLRLVTLDLKLGDDEEAGFVVLEHMTHARPDVLVAIVTGSDDPGVRKRARRLGVPVLPKPYPRRAMKRLVDRALAWPIPWEATARVIATRSRDWGLTRAEHRALCWRVAGRDAEAYRDEAGVAVSTFGFYLKEITRKARWGGGWVDLERALLRESLTAAET